jgi:hypothetical protein
MRPGRIAALVAILAGLTAAVALAAAPAVNTQPAQNVSQSGARLRGTVDPNTEPTTFYFDYGPTAAYGFQSPQQGPITGNTAQAVTADVSGLSPGTQYHFRLVAQNASGQQLGRDRVFTTPAAISLAANRNPVTFGDPITFTGQLQGGNVGGVRVALEENLYPFAGYGEVASVTTDPAGRFTFVKPPIAFSAYRVSAATQPVARSSTILALVRTRVSMKPSTTRPGRGRSVLFTGKTSPAHTGSTVFIQRLGRAGWGNVARATLTQTTDPLTGSYAVRLRRVKSGVYRAWFPVAPAHLDGTSAPRRVTVRR